MIEVLGCEWVKNTSSESAEWVLRVRSKVRVEVGEKLIAAPSPAPAVQVPEGYDAARAAYVALTNSVEFEDGDTRYVASSKVMEAFDRFFAASPAPATVAHCATCNDTGGVMDARQGCMPCPRCDRANAPATVATEAVQVPTQHGARPVRFVCVNPLALTDGAHLPMFRDSWRFAFWEQDGQLCFGMRDDGPLVAYDAVHRRQSPPECMTCSETWICQGGPGCKAGKPVAQGGGVDAEKVMALVEEYGVEMKDLGQHTAEGYALGIMQDEKEAARVLAELRALLSASPAWVGGWIPVGERLPEPQTDVLVFARHHQRPHVAQVMVAGLFGPHNNPRELKWMDNVSEGMIPRRWWVTHWQPLPPAPAATKKEEGHE